MRCFNICFLNLQKHGPCSMTISPPFKYLRTQGEEKKCFQLALHTQLLLSISFQLGHCVALQWGPAQCAISGNKLCLRVAFTQKYVHKIGLSTSRNYLECDVPETVSHVLIGFLFYNNDRQEVKLAFNSLDTRHLT